MDLTRKTSIEQAIKVAKENKKELFTKKTYSDMTSAHQFILTMEIKIGKVKVPKEVVYKAYSNWSDEPINKATFFRQFSEMFEQLEHNGKVCYLLNYQPFELLRESSQ